jgi:hypothetical protein
MKKLKKKLCALILAATIGIGAPKPGACQADHAAHPRARYEQTLRDEQQYLGLISGKPVSVVLSFDGGQPRYYGIAKLDPVAYIVLETEQKERIVIEYAGGKETPGLVALVEAAITAKPPEKIQLEGKRGKMYFEATRINVLGYECSYERWQPTAFKTGGIESRIEKK